ncbi:DUF202 domain-containing protein [Microbacterium sp. NPDC087589]|uniref:DUF202 domain-containing protein n=1 Tax=Microbacterium sp. NPDC087589 TaxID=3364191 RepID=UPI0037F1F58F
MTEPTLFDPGLQPERTELAWRRSALAIAVGSLISLRILPAGLPASFAAFGLVPGIVGILAACAIWVAARRRQVRLSAYLTGASLREPHGGGMLLSLTMLAVLFGGASILFVLIST